MFISSLGNRESLGIQLETAYQKWLLKAKGFLFAMTSGASRQEKSEREAKVVSMASKANFGLDGAEFSDIFEAHYEPLTLMAKNLVGDLQQAEDAVVDIFVRLWEKAKVFHNQEDAKAYLYVSVRNKCYDILRHEKMKKRINRYDLILNPSNQVVSIDDFRREVVLVETMNQVYRAIERLPNDYRQVVKMIFIENKTIQQVADELGKTYKSVTHLRSRALKELKINVFD